MRFDVIHPVQTLGSLDPYMPNRAVLQLKLTIEVCALPVYAED